MKKKSKILMVIISITLVFAGMFLYHSYTKQLMAAKIEKQITKFENQVKKDGFDKVVLYKNFISDAKKKIKKNDKNELKKISRKIEKMTESEKEIKNQYDDLVINMDKYNKIIKDNNLKIEKLTGYYNDTKKIVNNILIDKFEEANKKMLEEIKLADSLVKCNNDVNTNMEQWVDKTYYYSFYDSSLKKQLDKKIVSYNEYLEMCDAEKATDAINEIKKMVEKWDEKYSQNITAQQEANDAFADYLENEFEEQQNEEDEYDDSEYNNNDPFESYDEEKYLYVMRDIDKDGLAELIYADASLDSDSESLHVYHVKIYDYVNDEVESVQDFYNDKYDYYFNTKESKFLCISYIDHGKGIFKFSLRDGEYIDEPGNLNFESDWITCEGDQYYLDEIKISKEKYDQEDTKIMKDIEKNYISLFPENTTNKKENIFSSALKKYKKGIELGNYNEIRYSFYKPVNTIPKFDFGKGTNKEAKIINGNYKSEDFKSPEIFNVDIDDDGNDEEIEITKLYYKYLKKYDFNTYLGIKIDNDYYKMCCPDLCGSSFDDNPINSFVQLSSGKKFILISSSGGSDLPECDYLIVFKNKRPYLLPCKTLEKNMILSIDYVVNNAVKAPYIEDLLENGTTFFYRLLKFEGDKITLSNEGYFDYDNEKLFKAVKKEFNIYKDSKCKNKISKISKNMRVQFVSCILDSNSNITAIKIKTDDNRTGWIKVHTGCNGNTKDFLFEECGYAG